MWVWLLMNRVNGTGDDRRSNRLFTYSSFSLHVYPFPSSSPPSLHIHQKQLSPQLYFVSSYLNPSKKLNLNQPNQIETKQEFSSSWSSSSSSSSSSSTSWSSNSKDNSDSGKGDFPAVSATSDSLQQSPLSREVVACNVRSWWDIAGLEQERARAPPPAQQQSQQPTAGRSVGAKGSRTSYEQQVRAFLACTWYAV